MQLKENDLLSKIFWPAGKEEILGTLIHSFTNAEMTQTYEISISRQQDGLEIYYSHAPTFELKAEKVYLVQMIFEREGGELILNKEKTSPEISNPEGISMTLDSIEQNIIKMNVKPQFFSTGVLKDNNLTNTPVKIR